MDEQLIKTIKNGTVKNLIIHRYRALEINDMKLYQILTDEIMIKQTQNTIWGLMLQIAGWLNIARTTFFGV